MFVGISIPVSSLLSLGVAVLSLVRRALLIQHSDSL